MTQKKIIRYVLCAHAIFLAFIFFGSPLAPSKKQRKPLIVKTVTPKVTPTHVAATTPKAPARQAASVPPPKRAAPVQPKQTPPVAKKKPPVAKKEPAIADKQIKKNGAPPPKKKTPPDNRAKISEALKQQLQASIAQIEGKKQQPVPNRKPAPIQLHIDSVDQESLDSGYVGRMLSYLHQSLNLPEFGEVKIQLTLRQDGSIAKLVILNSESEKNRRYLESNLPRLHLPSLDGSLAKKAEQTFILAFCNEI